MNQEENKTNGKRKTIYFFKEYSKKSDPNHTYAHTQTHTPTNFCNFLRVTCMNQFYVIKGSEYAELCQHEFYVIQGSEYAELC